MISKYYEVSSQFGYLVKAGYDDGTTGKPAGVYCFIGEPQSFYSAAYEDVHNYLIGDWVYDLAVGAYRQCLLTHKSSGANTIFDEMNNPGAWASTMIPIYTNISYFAVNAPPDYIFVTENDDAGIKIDCTYMLSGGAVVQADVTKLSTNRGLTWT